MTEHANGSPSHDFNAAAAPPEIDLDRDFYEASNIPITEREYDEPTLTYDPPEPVPWGMGMAPSIQREDLRPTDREAFAEHLQSPAEPVPDRDQHVELDLDEHSGQEYIDWARDGEDERNDANTLESEQDFERRMREQFMERSRNVDHTHDHEQEC